jgi:hypothetical protein
MGTARRTGPWRALATLPAVAVLACAALMGGLSIAVAKDASIVRPRAVQAPAGRNVCAHTQDVDRLTIGRVSSFPQNHLHFTFPAQVTVTGAGRSQAVARALCALPAMPAGTFSCPMDWGINYRLVFTAGDSKLAPVTVDATGCQQVTGLGPVRWTALSPAFWSVLTTAADITSANQATFRGTLQSIRR